MDTSATFSGLVRTSGNLVGKVCAHKDARGPREQRRIEPDVLGDVVLRLRRLFAEPADPSALLKFALFPARGAAFGNGAGSPSVTSNAADRPSAERAVHPRFIPEKK